MGSRAIFALTRGYSEPEHYRVLVERNKAIKRNLGGTKAASVEMLLFHEGNISLSQQHAIAEASGENIRFISIGDYYERWNNANPYEESIGVAGHFLIRATRRDIDTGVPWSTGYRNMCHFYAIRAIEILGKLGYSHALRIDEDCIVESCLDKILNCGDDDQETLIGTPAMFMESHRLTNHVLPSFLRLTGISYVHEWRESYGTNSPMVYSNVNMYYVKNILSDRNCLQFLRVLNDSSVIHRCRAGDAPLLFWLSQTRKNGLKLLKELSYRHLSHKMDVSGGVVLK